LLIEERFCEILRIVEEKRTVTVQELTELLDTSESTIRRDLTALHNQGKLVKVHGGAIAVDLNYNNKDTDIAIRQDLNREEKIKIARYAASLIEANDVVFIDAGTTTGLMIDYITQTNALYITNGTVHAKRLAEKGCKTYILGGEYKLATEAIVGSEAIDCLKKYNFTKGFWGTNGVNTQTGFSTPDINEALVKKKAMEQTKCKYVLCDETKFSQISPVTFADFEDATIITTALADKYYEQYDNILEVD